MLSRHAASPSARLYCQSIRGMLVFDLLLMSVCLHNQAEKQVLR